MTFSAHPQSLSDRKGRLLERGGQLFRGIERAHAPFYEGVLASPALESLFALGLVGTRRAEIESDDYPLVLSHERIDFVAYWPEWPSLMLRDAAVMLCDLNLELMRHGCGILDCHPWNVLYDFTRPVFVDFSAVIPLEEAWLDEMAGRLRNYWVVPLSLISRGHPWFARSFRRTPDVGEPLDDLFKRRALAWFPLWYARLRRTARAHPSRFFERLRASLEDLSLPRGPRADGDTVCDGRDDSAPREAEERVLRSLLERLRPRTVLDICCHAGRRALLAESAGAKVVAFDDDEEHVNALYLRAKSEGRKILPLFLDFTVPTPAHGRKCEFPSSTERLRCDVSLLVGVLDRLVFHLDLSFPRVAQLLAAYTGRHAVVEFAPREDGGAHGRDWYDADNFVAAMGKYFRLEGVFDSDPPRKILLFEKR
jgi:SAM-dependent methyltransferase